MGHFSCRKELVHKDCDGRKVMAAAMWLLSASGSDDGCKLSFPLDGVMKTAQFPTNDAPYSISHAFDNYMPT